MDVYEILFKGEIMPTLDQVRVSARLATLFKAPAARIDALFDGQPHTLKSGLPRDEAERYRAALRDAGAIVYLRRTHAASQSATRPATKGLRGLSIAPMQGYLLREHERPAVTPMAVETGMLELAPQDGVPLAPPPPTPPAAPDTGHFTLAAAGTRLAAEPPAATPATPDISHLRLAAAGPLLAAHERPQEPPSLPPLQNFTLLD